MIRKCLASVSACVCIAAVGGAVQSSSPDPATHRLDASGAASMRLPFVENAGQVSDQNVRFVSRTFAGVVYVTADGDLVYSLPDKAEAGDRKSFPINEHCGAAVIGEKFVASGAAAILGGARSSATVNFFLGNDAARWRSNVPSFDSVERASVYPGIDLSIRAHGCTVEKVFTVAPDADPQDIVVNVSGAGGLRVDAAGQLVVHTELGDAQFSAPVAYQDGPRGREPVAVKYWVEGSCYGFELGDYDVSRNLVIDPLLAGTYLGGYAWDDALALAMDGEGRVYVAGATSSSDFPVTPGAYQITKNGSDVFVSLFDNRLTNLIASTYLGGTDVQTAYAVTLDTAGRVYVAGYTTSTNFPTTQNAYQRAHQSGNTADVFVAVLDGGLSNLLAATLLGGDAAEYANTITLDTSANVYVAGDTRSANFPTTATAFQKELKGWGDAFISKFDSGLEHLLSSTYLGGSNWDGVNSVKLDSLDAVFVTGITGGNGFPTTNLPYCSTFNGGEYDGFVSKFDGSLETLAYSTYIGGAGNDWPNAVIPESSLVYIAGSTYSSNFPVTAGAYQTRFQGGTNDGFVAAFDLGLHQLMLSSFLGGSDFDFIEDMERGSDGSVWVAGYTTSSNFPTSSDAYCRTNVNTDAFVARLDSQLTSLGASTLVGGIWDDYGYAMGLDAQGNVFVAGYTESYDFPTSPGAYERFYHVPTSPWHGDAFVIKMDRSLSAVPAPPINLAASNQKFTDHIVLSWIGADNAETYTVWRNTGPNSGEAAAITSVISSVTSVSDWQVAPGTLYYYWIKAANSHGESSFSDPASGARSPVCPLAADFDGDRKADPAVVTNGSWYLWLSSTGYPKIGPAVGADASWMSAAADFDGDAKADPTAMAANGGWYVWFSAGGYSRVGPISLGNGNASAVLADFDGDGLGDPAVVDGSTWQLWLSSAGYQPALPLTYGSADMIPLAADFDGDRYADFARYLDGAWYLWLSSAFYAQVGPLSYGESGTLPVAADFDGDGKADPAVYKLSTGEWYVWLSSAGYFRVGPFPFHP